MTDPLLRTIELTPLEQRIYERYTNVQILAYEDETHHVWLVSRNQRFKLCKAEDTEHADWWRKMIAKGIAHIVETEANGK